MPPPSAPRPGRPVGVGVEGIVAGDLSTRVRLGRRRWTPTRALRPGAATHRRRLLSGRRRPGGRRGRNLWRSREQVHDRRWQHGPSSRARVARALRRGGFRPTNPPIFTYLRPTLGTRSAVHRRRFGGGSPTVTRMTKHLGGSRAAGTARSPPPFLCEPLVMVLLMNKIRRTNYEPQAHIACVLPDVDHRRDSLPQYRLRGGVLSRRGLRFAD